MSNGIRNDDSRKMVRSVEASFRMKTPEGVVSNFRNLDDALSEAEHWRLDKHRTTIEDTRDGVQRSVAEWLEPCGHEITHPVLTESGEPTGDHRCPLCGKIL